MALVVVCNGPVTLLTELMRMIWTRRSCDQRHIRSSSLLLAPSPLTNQLYVNTTLLHREFSQSFNNIQLAYWSKHISVWDHWVRQRSSYQLLEGRHWVTERFLSLPPGRGTVCRQQSLLRQHCIHSAEPWKLIYPPHGCVVLFIGWFHRCIALMCASMHRTFNRWTE